LTRHRFVQMKWSTAFSIALIGESRERLIEDAKP
jgi:hypothetical protein